MAIQNSWAKLVTEIIALWKVFIATRQEAYERKMNKNQEKAINIAEASYELMGEIFDYLYEFYEIHDDKEFLKMKEELYKLKKKFNKYD